MNAAENELYFRLRPGGATVFRVTEMAKDRRMDLVQIANLNLKNASIKPSKNEALSEDETQRIQKWLNDRLVADAQSNREQIGELIDRLGLAAHWIKADAGDEDIAAIERQLLLAMHDLRQVLVRRKSN